MRVTRRRGVARVLLEPFEVEVLSGLLGELEDVLEQMDAEDPVVRRLFPDGYQGDPEAAADFRGLTESSLQDSRRERYASMRATLPEAGGLVEVSGDTEQAWLRCLNDMRLALGTRLQITADTDPQESEQGPEAGMHALYQWLTTLQESLVQAVMR